MSSQNCTEAKLEEAIIQLLGSQGYPYTRGTDIRRSPTDVLIRSDLRDFLNKRYSTDRITEGEIDSMIRQLDALNAADLYDSNKTICKWVSDGFLLKREDRNQKDLYIQLIDYDLSSFASRKKRSAESPGGDALLSRNERRHSDASLAAEKIADYSVSPSDSNIYRVVNQLEIEGREKRIPDVILYIKKVRCWVAPFDARCHRSAIGAEMRDGADRSDRQRPV